MVDLSDPLRLGAGLALAVLGGLLTGLATTTSLPRAVGLYGGAALLLVGVLVTLPALLRALGIRS